MTNSPYDVRAVRIYDAPSDADGVRVLVDRVWPRGISKERAHLDEWCKTVAPSKEALHHLRDLAGQGPLTLLTATKDLEISQAAVLAGLVQH